MCCIMPLLLSAQTIKKQTDRFSIADYRYSTVLMVGDRNVTTNLFSDFGGFISEKKNEGYAPYLFNGQEYVANLDLYFFPNRSYNTTLKRFIETDPASQYFSPYTFVGNDPVNFIDKDGNEGHPLVLYYEEPKAEGGIPESTRDLMQDVPDAHYVSMSDFMMDKVSPLKEWNGNVFFHTPTTKLKDSEIAIGRADHPRQIRYAGRANRGFFRAIKAPDGGFHVTTSAREAGEQLRVLANDSKVALNNITFSGSDGSIAAERLLHGATDPKLSHLTKSKNGIKASGLEEGLHGFMSGPRVSAEGGAFVGAKKTRFYFGPKEAKIQPTYDLYKSRSGDKLRFTGYEGDLPNGTSVPLDYISSSGVRDVINGEESRLAGKFRSLKLPY